jgi:hypothetical protein
MADRSNYADKPVNDDLHGALVEHKDRLSSNPRAYTPSDTESDYGGHSTLAEVSNGGDWSWRPARNKRFPQFEMPALNGTLKGMPEQLGRAREAAGEPGAIRYGNTVLPIRKYPKLIAGANGGWFDTLAGSHVGTRTPRRVDIEILGSDIDRSYSAGDVYSEFCPA